MQIECSSLIFVEEGSILRGTRRRGKCSCHHASEMKTPLQRDDLLAGSRTGERSTQHSTQSQNARSPQAPATLPEHRELVVHPAPTRWPAQLTARAGTVLVGPRNPGHSYAMQSTILASSSAEKDLGVFIDPELKFRKQASSAVSKTTQILTLVCRSFANINEITLRLLFNTLVREHLEYGSLIWGPFNQADEKLVERVQRRATKMVENIRSKPYPERLRYLKLPSLYHRRRR